MEKLVKCYYKDSPSEHTKHSNGSNNTAVHCKMEQLVAKLPALGEQLTLESKIGEGTFSSVYLARSKDNPNDKYAVKHLIPTCHPSKIVRELKCMHQLGGEKNIVEVLMCLHVHDCVVFVMPYLPHDKFNNYIKDMSPWETQMYIKQLLVALRRVHSQGIIHRDIKPSNFLFNRTEKKFLLVDFGLAQTVDGNIKNENGENIDCDKSFNSSCDKKRKRDPSESSQDHHVVKRPALQQLSSNVTYFSWDEAINKKTNTYSNPTKKCSLSQSFTSISPKDTKISFVRVQNSQVKALGGVFAKPLPLSKGGGESVRCHCDGRPRVCNLCITRKEQQAPRAGTPGFRPPEVLLKYKHQTTAVDIWAVGVIFLCILSSTYPFFRSPDDITALAEIITIFGSKEMKDLAKKLGRNIVCSEDNGPLDLKRLCLRLRMRKVCDSKKRKSSSSGNETTAPSPSCERCKVETSLETGCLCPGPLSVVDPLYPDSAYDLLRKMLDIDPQSRITAEEALCHPFINLKL